MEDHHPPPPAREGWKWWTPEKTPHTPNSVFLPENSRIVKEGGWAGRKAMPDPRRDGADFCFDMLDTQRARPLSQLLMDTVKDSILEWGVLDIQWRHPAFPPQNNTAEGDSITMELCGDRRGSAAIGWLFFCLTTASVQSFSSKLFAYMKLLTRIPQIMPKYL